MIKHCIFCIALHLTGISFVHAQKKFSLEGKKIKALEIRTGLNDRIVPGNSISLGVIAKTEKGDELATEGFLGGNTRWDNYIVETGNGNFNKGMILIESDGAKIATRKLTIKVTDKFDTTKVAEKMFDISFDTDYQLDVSGSNGYDGIDGEPGKPGRDGRSSRSSEPGEDGGNGGNGRNGKPGGDGKNGANLSIWIKAFDNDELKTKTLKVTLKDDDTGKEYHYLMYADKNVLNINANGGNGGNAGNAGDGGRGGRGGTGSYDQAAGLSHGGKGGNGGDAGNAGSAGNGGNAGTIKLYADPSAAKYAANIKFNAQPGKGGTKGRAGKGGAQGEGAPGGLGAGYNGGMGTGGTSGVDGNDGSLGSPPVIQNVEVKLDW